MMVSADRNLLYWPGMRRRQSDLAVLLEGIQNSGWAISTVVTPYDTGPPPSSPLSTMLTDTAVVSGCSWWLGLSLGASVAFAVLPQVSPKRQPNRLTMINPFMDRQLLAQQRGFDMSSQWRISLNVQLLPPRLQLDIVVSDDDDRVPPNHGVSLHREAGTVLCSKPNLIRVPGSHVLEGNDLQRRLASELLDLK